MDLFRELEILGVKVVDIWLPRAFYLEVRDFIYIDKGTTESSEKSFNINVVEETFVGNCYITILSIICKDPIYYRWFVYKWNSLFLFVHQQNTFEFYSIGSGGSSFSNLLIVKVIW